MVSSPEQLTHLSKSNKESLPLIAKQMLQNRLFIGNYQEKRFVSCLQAYRDVVVVSKEETDLIRDLEAIKKQLAPFYHDDQWIGITNPNTIGTPAGHCVWVELHEEVFGSYWYKIKRIKFKENEVLLKLKTIRPVETSVTNISTKSSQLSDTFTKENLQEIVTEYLTWFFTSVITLRNTKETLTFLSVLLAALVTGFINILQYLGDFTLKLMRETSHLIHVLTPSIIAFINLCAKIVGGFYLLILSMWKTRSTPTYQGPPKYQSPYITYSPDMQISDNYNTVYFKRALPPAATRKPSGVIITPLD